jgi:protein-tyrosine phosphatase
MPTHSDRLWQLQGASNFRDLGGYPGHGGRPLRWRRLFRSAHLAGLTARDQAALAPLGVGKVLDFRGRAERAEAPYELPGAEQHSLAIEPTVAQRLYDLLAGGRRVGAAQAAALMHDLYRGLVNDQALRFAEFFDHLLHADTALVFHCTAGKDRTGLAAALLLLALGVPRPLVMRDYLLSREAFRHPPLPADEALVEAAAVLWSVDEGFLEVALHALDHDQGGVERYLGQRLGLSPAALQRLAERWLQPA